ncbi:NASP-related protein sim3 isoform X2 [Solanum lycopersicum]|uniref:NASP-related protein sim3 isoform X2 n=1 Tax=Solanum lycopersicum TaxID=4081 RepID=UPI000532D521|nr:NASP-related protein sim3 isoform X2 [Solanum lycopersicum]
MAEEAVISVTSPTAEQNQNSVNATIESGVQGGTESTCNNNNNNAESSAVTSDVNREKSLEYADELVVKGSKASEDGDYGEAVECFSRALEIRVAHFGELAPECINAYYKYGCALLYKAQDEADPLVSLPKKDSGSQQDSNRDGSVKSVVSCESSISSTAEPGGSSNGKEKVEDDEENEDEGDEEESDDEDLAEGDEDETDLDLAWKLLDVARAIAEKHAGDTMEKVDVLSALAEVALEREDIETSLSDYLKALSILERLVEPDSRHIAALNFRICLCLEIGSKHQEAIPYCQKAILTCKSRLQRLTEEIKLLSESTERLATTDVDQIARQSSSISQSDSVSAKEAEVETLTELSAELEKKLEDLQQCMSNPSSILSDILGMVSAKARSLENADASVAVNSSQMGVGTSGSGSFDSPTVSTAHTNGAAGITHLGVVGRGVKRVHLNTTTESSPAKKPASEQPSDNGDGTAS